MLIKNKFSDRYYNIINQVKKLNRVKNSNKLVTNKSYHRSKYLTSLGTDCIGQSFKDLGFDFIN